MATTYTTGGFDAPVVYKDKALSSTVVNIYASSCNLTGWRITNPNSTTAYVRFFNAASTSSISLGTTEPVKEFSIPSQGEIFVSHSRTISQYYFHNGLNIVAVTGLATSSTGTPIIPIDVEIYYTKDIRNQ